MRLIIEYKNRPVLWQVNHPSYGMLVPMTKALMELTLMLIDNSKHRARSVHLYF